MKLNPEDVHALTIIAMDPHGQLAELLIPTLSGTVLEVAQGLTGEKPLAELEESVQSAVEEFQGWADQKQAVAA